MADGMDLAWLTDSCPDGHERRGVEYWMDLKRNMETPHADEMILYNCLFFLTELGDTLYVIMAEKSFCTD